MSMYASYSNTITAGGLTTFIAFGISSSNITESNRQNVMPNSGTINEMRIVAVNSVTPGDVLTFQLRKNGVDAGSPILFNAGDGSTQNKSVALSVSYVAGDLIGLKIISNATSPSTLRSFALGIT